MRFDGKKPIEFTDETVKLEEENLEETKYKLKVDAPAEPANDIQPDLGGEEGGDGLDMGTDIGGDKPIDDKPFDDEPFDAGVESDEDTDPEKYIQQLSGKLGQSLRKYTEDTGQPDFDLEKFAINSVVSATHTAEMDEEDQKDIINKVKTSGKGDGGDGLDMGDESGEEGLDFGADEEVDTSEDPLDSLDDGDLEENIEKDSIEYFTTPEQKTIKRVGDSIMWKLNPTTHYRIKLIGVDNGRNVWSYSKRSSEFDDGASDGHNSGQLYGKTLDDVKNQLTMVNNGLQETKSIILNKLREMREEPVSEPKRTREVDRPFTLIQKDKINPDSKSEDNGIIQEED